VVSSGPVVKPVQNSAEPVEVSVASRQANVEAPPEKRGLLSHVNPVNLFRRDAKPASPAKREDLPEGTRRYAYQNIRRPADGDRAAAEKVFAVAWQAHQAGRLEDAIKSYREATRLDPAYFDAHFNLGIATSAAGDVGAAMAAYETALAIRPDAVDARYNFAVLLKRAGYPVDCALELEKILGSRPDDPRAHLLLGNLYAQSFGQPARARAHYETVLKVDPKNPQAPMIRYWLASQRP